jgi:ABC-type transport system involved in multi-copper enzyme maturation permease subunit
MQRLLAIAWLTWKAALRFRLFLVIAVLLLVTVVALPMLIKDDGTARGFTQILLTYTLGIIATLLGMSTLWLACGTLARDIEECQIQVVATKPVARWQIWVGKWLGLMSLNAALLLISGAGVYFLLQWRATKLPAAQQAILRNEVLVARSSARERSFDKEINEQTEKLLLERVQKFPADRADMAEVRRQILEQVKAEFQVVPPGGYRPWEIQFGSAKDSLKDQPLFVRIKFNSAQKSESGTFDALWQIGVPQKTQIYRAGPMSLAPDTFHEFQIPANLIDENGVLTIVFINSNNATLLFPLEDGMEVLYREGGFLLNYARGLGIIFCWMALLCALGLAAASLLSFPVAAFFSLGVLAISLSTGTISNAVEQGTIADYDSEKGTSGSSPADVVVIPVFKATLKLISLVKDFSPVDALSTGRSITWSELARAFLQIVVLMGGIFAVSGVVILNRRELATAQGNQ